MRYLILLLITNFVFAQHAEQPLPEDTDDARMNTTIFEVKDSQNSTIYTLERSPYFDHFLRYKKKKNEKLQKADSRLTKNLDGQFTSLYFKTMYEMENKKGQCKEVYLLTLRGEGQQICKKDDQKAQLIKSFIQLLEKQF